MADITLTPSMRSNLLQLQGTSKLMDMTQARISTGKKINSALDGPVSFFQAKSLTNKASDLAALKDNMGQGISSLKTADTALTSISSLLDQMKGLATSAKSSQTASERASLSAQFDDMRGQIDKLATDADYNGTNLVNGRGMVTGGTFIDDASALEVDTGISDFSTANQTQETTFDVKFQQDATTTISASGGNFDAFMSAGDGGLQYSIAGWSDNSNDLSVSMDSTGTIMTFTDGDDSATLSVADLNKADGKTTDVVVGDLTITLTNTANWGTAANLDATQTATLANDVTSAVAGVAEVSTLTFSDAFASAGESITVLVDGVTATYTVTTADLAGTATADLAAVATGITAAINALDLSSTTNVPGGVTATSAAGVVTITGDVVGQDLTMTAAVASDASGTVILALPTTAVTPVYESDTLTLTGAWEAGDKLSSVIDGVTVEYTVLAEDLTTDGSSSSDLGSAAQVQQNVGVKFAAAVDAADFSASTNLSAGVSTSVAGGVVTITASSDTANFALVSSTAANGTTGTAPTWTADTSSVISKTLTAGTQRAKITEDGSEYIATIVGGSSQTLDRSTTGFSADVVYNVTEASIAVGLDAKLVVTNPTGTGDNDMNVAFNEDGTAFVNSRAVDASVNGLGVDTTVGDWATDANINTAIADISSAIANLRTAAQTLATDLSLIQTRDDFTAKFINTLEEGADKLTLADGNEEAANMLILQTRQQLGIQALSMASQSAQSILTLFR